MNAGPSIYDLIPEACWAVAPFDVQLGDDFDALVIPATVAADLLSDIKHTRAQYVGAVMCAPNEWTLLLPPSSGLGMDWGQLVELRESGRLIVPPLGAVAGEPLYWSRRGNQDGRAFSAPFCIYPLVGAKLALGQEVTVGQAGPPIVEDPMVLLPAVRSRRDLVSSPGAGTPGAFELTGGRLSAVGITPVVLEHFPWPVGLPNLAARAHVREPGRDVDDGGAVDGVEVGDQQVAAVDTEQARAADRELVGAAVVAVDVGAGRRPSGLPRGLRAWSCTSAGLARLKCQVTVRWENSSIPCRVSRGKVSWSRMTDSTPPW